MALGLRRAESNKMRKLLIRDREETQIAEWEITRPHGFWSFAVKRGVIGSGFWGAVSLLVGDYAVGRPPTATSICLVFVVGITMGFGHCLMTLTMREWHYRDWVKNRFR